MRRSNVAAFALTAGLILVGLGSIEAAADTMDLHSVWYERTDRFTHPTELAPYWSWINEVPAKWNLDQRPGCLTIHTQRAGLPTDPHNVLLQGLSPFERQQDFEIETAMIFSPWVQFHFAGIVVLEEEDAFVKLGRSFCYSPGAPGVPCVDNGIYFDRVEDGGWPNTPNFATQTCMSFTSWLRITRIEDELRGYYSEDGVHWVLIGTHDLAFDPMYVGILVEQTSGMSNEESIPASFDYFTVRFFAPECSLDQPDPPI